MSGFTNIFLAQGPSGDPYWDQVILLLDFDDGTIADESSFNQSTALQEDVVVVSNDSVSGDYSLYFPTTSINNGLAVTTVGDSWDAGTSDWTVEMYLRRNEHNTTNYLYNVGFVRTGFWSPNADPNTVRYYYSEEGGGTTGPLSTGAFAPWAWSHYAYVRDGAWLYGYINGVLDTSVNIGAAIDLVRPGVSQNVYLGHVDPTSNVGLEDTWMDMVRVTMGTCRYPGGTTFTPPTEYPKG